MKPGVRQFTAFGEDNHLAIEAQIDALQELITDDDELENFASDLGWTEREKDNARTAMNWLLGEKDTPPSKDWLPLVS